MLKDDKIMIQQVIKNKAEQTKNDVLEILSNELRQIKARLTKLENKLSEKPAYQPKK